MEHIRALCEHANVKESMYHVGPYECGTDKQLIQSDYLYSN